MSTINIPRMPSATPSASSTPSASPTTEHHDRLNALLATFEAGTHAFSRGDEWSEGSRISKDKFKSFSMASSAAPTAQPQPQPQPQSKQGRRPSWVQALSLLSLSRPDQPRHFDPSREPKLHGLP